MPFLSLAPNLSVDPERNESLSIFYEYYDQRQGEDGPTVILIHGAGLQYLSWPPQLRRLPGAAVYALDLPGHGASEPLTGSVTIATYAAVVNQFIAQLSLEEVVLAGHSMGAAIALTCALSAPTADFAAIVLVGAGATMPVNQRIFDGLQQDFDGMTAKLVSWMYGPTWPEHYRQRAVDDLRQNSIEQLVADFAACNAFDLRNRLGTIALPTLILCGEVDKMTPLAFSQELATLIPQSELIVIPQVGHMVMLEAAESVTQHIQNFLT